MLLSSTNVSCHFPSLRCRYVGSFFGFSVLQRSPLESLHLVLSRTSFPSPPYSKKSAFSPPIPAWPSRFRALWFQEQVESVHDEGHHATSKKHWNLVTSPVPSFFTRPLPPPDPATITSEKSDILLSRTSPSDTLGIARRWLRLDKRTTGCAARRAASGRLETTTRRTN